MRPHLIPLVMALCASPGARPAPISRPRQRVRAMRELGKQGLETIPKIQAYLSDPVVDVRVEAGTGKLAQGGVWFVFPNDMLKVEAEPNRLNDQVLVRYYEHEWREIARWRGLSNANYPLFRDTMKGGHGTRVLGQRRVLIYLTRRSCTKVLGFRLMPVGLKLLVVLIFLPVYFLWTWRFNNTHYRFGYRWMRRVRPLGPGVPSWLSWLSVALWIATAVVVVWPER